VSCAEKRINFVNAYAPGAELKNGTWKVMAGSTMCAKDLKKDDG
jgi:hypothetical protein